MAQTPVNTPDGGTIMVTHPEGASREQILRFAKQQYSPNASLSETNPAEYDPNSPEFQAKYGATAGMSGFEKFLSGAGKEFTDIGRGVRQRAAEGLGFFSDNFRDRAQQLRDEQKIVEQRDAPLMSTGAGQAGALTANVASFLPAGGLATTIPRAIALGATEGALRPTTEADDVLSNTAIGGAFGLGGELLGRGVRRAARPFTRSGGNIDEAADLLRREGVELDVSQVTNNAGAQRLRGALGDNPLTAGGQQRFAEKQRRQFTKAILKTIGQDADEVTEDVLNRARNDIGGAIDDAAVRKPALFDTDLVAEVNNIKSELPFMGLDDAAERSLNNNIDRLLESAAKNDGFIPGQVFIKTRSSLSSLSRKTPIARQLEEAMLDALDRSGGSRSGLKKALAQYRNLLNIENSIDKGVDRFVSPLRLSNTLDQKRNRALSQRGLGHPLSKKLADLARAGRSILPEAMPNSGTFPRALAGEALLFGGGALGGLAAGQDLSGAAAVGAGAAALPFAAQSLLNNQGLLGRYAAGGLPGGGIIDNDLVGMLARQGAISSGLLSE